MAMRGHDLLEKLGLVDMKWVADAAQPRKKRRGVVWVSSVAAVAAAACVALGCFVMSDAFIFSELPHGSTEDVLLARVCVIEDHLANYVIVEHTEMQRKMLSLKKGELYMQSGDTTIYRYEGRDDLAYLIFEYNGVLQLGEFDSFTYAYGEELVHSFWYDVLGEEQLEKIVPVTSVSEVLRLIYHVESVEDLKSITFQHRYYQNTNAKIATMTLRDKQTLAEFYGILSTLEFHREENWRDVPVSDKQAARQEAVKALNIHSSHFSRTMKVKLKSGYELTMAYNGYEGTLKIGSWIRLDDVANDWLIEHAEIDFTDQGYAENPIVTMGETATVPPVPSDTAEPSDDDATTIGSPPLT